MLTFIPSCIFFPDSLIYRRFQHQITPRLVGFAVVKASAMEEEGRDGCEENFGGEEKLAKPVLKKSTGEGPEHFGDGYRYPLYARRRRRIRLL